MNFAPGREDDKGRLDDPTPTSVVRQDGVRGAACGNAGHCRPQYGSRPRNAARRFLRHQTRAHRARRGWSSGAEIFNLLNHTNFGNPDGNISNPTAGMITTADDARSMQFGLRLAW